jgi:hypothetical protein
MRKDACLYFCGSIILISPIRRIPVRGLFLAQTITVNEYIEQQSLNEEKKAQFSHGKKTNGNEKFVCSVVTINRKEKEMFNT